MDGYRTLKAGQNVLFEIEEGDKGLHASHIRPAVSDTDTKTETPVEATQESPTLDITQPEQELEEVF